MPPIDGWEIAASWQPATGVGGDCYDAIAFGRIRLGLSIADVVGKGIPAALLMSNLQAAVRAFATEAAQPAELCQQVNRILCGRIAEDRFISFFYCVIDCRARTPDVRQRRPLRADPGARRRAGRTAGVRRPGAWRVPRRRLRAANGFRSAAGIVWSCSPMASPRRARRQRTRSSARTAWWSSRGSIAAAARRRSRPGSPRRSRLSPPAVPGRRDADRDGGGLTPAASTDWRAGTNRSFGGRMRRRRVETCI